MAFQTLKRRFSEEPVLMIPDPTRPFQIKTNASKHATGAVLTQTDGNGDRHPCAFISKTFSPTERNYEIYDRGWVVTTFITIAWQLPGSCCVG